MNGSVEKKHFLLTQSVIVIIGIIIIIITTVGLTYELSFNLFWGRKTSLNALTIPVILQIPMLIVLIPFCGFVSAALVYQYIVKWIITDKGVLIKSILPDWTFKMKIYFIHNIFIEWSEISKIELIESVITRNLCVRMNDGKQLYFFYLVDVNNIGILLRVVNNHVPVDKFNITAQKYLNI